MLKLDCSPLNGDSGWPLTNANQIIGVVKEAFKRFDKLTFDDGECPMYRGFKKECLRNFFVSLDKKVNFYIPKLLPSFRFLVQKFFQLFKFSAREGVCFEGITPDVYHWVNTILKEKELPF